MTGYQIVIAFGISVLFNIIGVVGYHAFMRSEAKEWEQHISAIITSTRVVVAMEHDIDVLRVLCQMLCTPNIHASLVGAKSPVLLVELLSTLLVEDMVDYPLKEKVLALTDSLWNEYQRHPDYHSCRVDGSRWRMMLISALGERWGMSPGNTVSY